MDELLKKSNSELVEIYNELDEIELNNTKKV